MSRYKDGERPANSNDLPDPPQPGQTVSSIKTQFRAVKNAILFGVVVVLVALLGTELRGPITKTMERFGRSLALQGQFSVQWSETETNHQ